MGRRKLDLLGTERASVVRATAQMQTAASVPSLVAGLQHTPTSALFYLDGVAQTSTGTTYSALADFNFNAIGFFGQTFTTGDRGTGRLSGFVLYSVEASLDLRQRVEGYLAQVHKLADRLAADHPYKTSGPRKV